MASKTIDVLPTDEFRVGNVLHQIRGWKQHRCVWVDGGVGPWVDTTALFAPAIPHSQALAILAAYGLTVEQPPEPVRVTHAVLDTGDNLYIRFGSEQACKDYVASYDFTNCKVVPCPFTFGGGA